MGLKHLGTTSEWERTTKRSVRFNVKPAFKWNRVRCRLNGLVFVVIPINFPRRILSIFLHPNRFSWMLANVSKFILVTSTFLLPIVHIIFTATPCSYMLFISFILFYSNSLETYEMESEHFVLWIRGELTEINDTNIYVVYKWKADRKNNNNNNEQ